MVYEVIVNDKHNVQSSGDTPPYFLRRVDGNTAQHEDKKGESYRFKNAKELEHKFKNSIRKVQVI